jgi:TfoX/Sxy family transcriptional regulator of competence genes
MEKFEKSNEKVMNLLSSLIQGIDCESRKMFGYPVAFINGNMFTGTFADRLFFRIEKEEQKDWKNKYPGIKDFEPVKGRVMKEYLEISGDEKNMQIMKELVQVSHEYCISLPVKEKKAKPKKKK